MQRCIADARRILEERATALNPEAYQQYDSEITQAEAAARQRATGHVQSLYDDHAPTARQVSEQICTVRDQARCLTEQINTGRITNADAAAELERLRSAARTQRTGRDRLVRVADRMDAIEDDPIGWYSDLSARFPHMQPDFSF